MGGRLPYDYQSDELVSAPPLLPINLKQQLSFELQRQTARRP